MVPYLGASAWSYIGQEAIIKVLHCSAFNEIISLQMSVSFLVAGTQQNHLDYS